MFNEEPTDEQLADACMWHRHDFGLLDDNDKRLLMHSMRDRWRAIWKACNTPGRGGQYMPSNAKSEPTAPLLAQVGSTDGLGVAPHPRGALIRATMYHDAGAYARCSYCGLYSDRPEALSKDNWPCDCGKLHGWSGSFRRPDVHDSWSEAVPARSKEIGDREWAAQPAGLREGCVTHVDGVGDL